MILLSLQEGHSANDEQGRGASAQVVVHDPSAPPLWARFYELGTNVPLFANRDGTPVYSLAEVDRERRTGYAWCACEPEAVLEAFSHWNQRSRL